MAQVEASVKAVQFNYINFLWNELRRIREAKVRGQYMEALELLCSLIGEGWLPERFREELLPKVEQAQKDLQTILTQHIAATSSFVRSVRRRKQVMEFAVTRFQPLMRQLNEMLEHSNYKEKLEFVEEGYSHTLLPKSSKRPKD